MNIFSSRKFRQGSAATLVTVFVIALVVVINMVAGALSSKFSLTFDLTANKVYTLSSQTKELLSSLDKDVTIYILSEEEYFKSGGSYYVQANELIKRYSQANPRIQVIYKDVIKDPAFVANYPDFSLGVGSVIVECGENAVALAVYDLLNMEINYYTGSVETTSSKAEQAVSSAILNVTSETRIPVTVIEGHGEADISAFTSVLEMNGYDVSVQNLMTDPEINPDTKIAVMAAPLRDISEAESKKIDTFLKNDEHYGKIFFYMASVQQPAELPVIDALLAEWGIAVNPGAVFELSSTKRYDTNYFCTLADYMEDEYSYNVQMKGLSAAMPESRPLELLFTDKGFYSTKGLLEFSQTSGVKGVDKSSDWVPTANDVSGPIPSLVLSKLIKYEQSTPTNSYMLVSGTEGMMLNYLIGSRNIANSEYFLDVLGSLSGREATIKIQDKTLDTMSLGIESFQVIIVISVILTIVLPLAVLAFGIVIWLRRRHR